jgi:hypothetical protein
MKGYDLLFGSLLHKCQVLHQSTYLNLTEDQELTSHQVVLDFIFPVRYYCMSFSLVDVFHT